MNSKKPETAEELKEIITGSDRSADNVLNIKNHYHHYRPENFFGLRGAQSYKSRIVKKKTVALVNKRGSDVTIWYVDARINFCYDYSGKLYDIYYSDNFKQNILGV